MNLLKRKWYVLPVYSVGVVWLLWAVFRRFSSFGDYLLCTLLSLLTAVLLHIVLRSLWGGESQQEQTQGKEPEKKEVKQEPATDPLIQQGRSYCAEIESLNEQIPDHEMSARMKQMTLLTDQILDVVDKQPEKKPKIRQMMNYYLPTVTKLLKQYLLLQEQEVTGENIEQGKEKIRNMLEDVNTALKKQLDDMFEADLVDITAEIRVMEKKLAAEGLSDNTIL